MLWPVRSCLPDRWVGAAFMWDQDACCSTRLSALRHHQAYMQRLGCSWASSAQLLVTASGQRPGVASPPMSCSWGALLPSHRTGPHPHPTPTPPAPPGFQVSPVLGWPAVVGGLAASVGLTSSGFLLQTRGFKVGSMLVVCTLAAAAAMVSGEVGAALAGCVGVGGGGPRLAVSWGREACCRRLLACNWAPDVCQCITPTRAQLQQGAQQGQAVMAALLAATACAVERC